MSSSVASSSRGRAGNLTADDAVSVLMSSIDTQTGSIVLAHSVDDLRIV